MKNIALYVIIALLAVGFYRLWKSRKQAQELARDPSAQDVNTTPRFSPEKTTALKEAGQQMNLLGLKIR